MMKYLKNFRILFLIFFIAKTIFANEINNIHFINSYSNNLTEINQYSFKNFLDNKNLNLINYSNNINSIFDQADIYEEIAQLHTNKIIIFVDKSGLPKSDLDPFSLFTSMKKLLLALKASFKLFIKSYSLSTITLMLFLTANSNSLSDLLLP